MPSSLPPDCGRPVWSNRAGRLTSRRVAVLAAPLEEEVVEVPLLVLQEPVLVQELPEVPLSFLVTRALQPTDVLLVLDVPVPHTFECLSVVAQLEQLLAQETFLKFLYSLRYRSRRPCFLKFILWVPFCLYMCRSRCLSVKLLKFKPWVPCRPNTFKSR